MIGARIGIVVVALGIAVGCDALRGERPQVPPSSSAEDTPPEVIAVDWLGRGTLYAGRVIGRREGLTGVEYADGDREWVEGGRIRPWPELTEGRITVWMRAGAQPVTVIETRGSLVHVRFDDGTHTWVARETIYALSAPEMAVDGGGGGAPNPDRAFPVRPSVEPGRVRAGTHALVYWVNDAGVQRGAPWLVAITAVDGDAVSVRYLSDGSEGTVSRAEVLRVFDPPGVMPAAGDRVWLADVAPVGTVVATRAGFVQVRSGEQLRWVELGQVLGPAPTIEPSRLEPGVTVTALWSATAPYHGEVVSLDGEQVTLAWHDGSSPSPVPVADVVEVWQGTGETHQPAQTRTPIERHPPPIPVRRD